MTTVHRISVPNPFFEGRNSVYLIPSDPVTLVDTGVATDKAYQRLCAGIEEFGLSVRDIRRVVLTHKHIDHIGNAWRLHRECGAELFIHEFECKSITDVDPSGARFGDLVDKKLQTWGAPPRESTPAASQMPEWRLEAAEVTPLRDGQSLQQGAGELSVMHTPGHTMGSLCLIYDGQLFSGDHVLREISPNVGGGDMRSRGMLGRFLESLQRTQQLGDMRVLPGHGEPFDDLTARCSELLSHHEARLDQTTEALQDGAKTVYEVALTLFGELRDFHIVLGCAEANAHLELLVDRGLALQEGDRFRAA